MRIIKVFPDKTIRKKNSWNWRVQEPSKTKAGAVNVLYTAQGYDTKAIAKRQAKRHNGTLLSPLFIEVVATPKKK